MSALLSPLPSPLSSYPEDIDITKKELYLTTEDFQRCFGMVSEHDIGLDRERTEEAGGSLVGVLRSWVGQTSVCVCVCATVTVTVTNCNVCVCVCVLTRVCVCV